MEPKNNNQSNPNEARQKRIEEFLLDPEKVIFQSIEEFKAAAEEVLSILRGVDLETLEKLQGADGKTPERGVDYFTEEDLQAIEEFIISKVPQVGKELPSTQQVIDYIRQEVAKIPRIKGEDGKSFTFADLTEAQKEELRGKDGSPDSPVDIIKKIRSLRKTNQGLEITDIRGLKNTLQSLIDAVDEIPGLREAIANFKVVIPASAVNDGGGGGGLTTEQVQDIVAAMFTGATHSGASVAYDDVTGTIAITVSGGGGGLTEEQVEDIMSTFLVGGTGISLTYDDVANSLSVALTGESFTTAMKTKVDFIAVTQAVNLDTMESDILSAKTKTDHITVTQPVDLDAIETRVNALDAAVVLKGVWDASAGTFPGGGTAQAGDSWIVSVGGTVNGVVFTANDRIVAIVDNASTATYAANWHKLDYTDAVLSVDGQTGAIDLAAILAAKADKATPVDADSFPIIDSAAGNALKELTFTNLKAFLKTYFDTLYQPLAAILTGLAAMGTGVGSVHQTAAATFVKRTLTGTTNLITVTDGDGVAGNPTFTVGNLVVQTTATQTLTNKRVNPRVVTIASGATITPAGDTSDQVIVTALAINTTIAAPTGTPVDGQRLILRITSDATPRTISWNAIYRAIGITLPTTTVASKTFYVGFVYNSLAVKWDAIAYALEA